MPSALSSQSTSAPRKSKSWSNRLSNTNRALLKNKRVTVTAQCRIFTKCRTHWTPVLCETSSQRSSQSSDKSGTERPRTLWIVVQRLDASLTPSIRIKRDSRCRWAARSSRTSSIPSKPRRVSNGASQARLTGRPPRSIEFPNNLDSCWMVSSFCSRAECVSLTRQSSLNFPQSRSSMSLKKICAISRIWPHSTWPTIKSVWSN